MSEYRNWPAELAWRDKQLADAQAEIERLKAFVAAFDVWAFEAYMDERGGENFAPVDRARRALERDDDG